MVKSKVFFFLRLKANKYVSTLSKRNSLMDVEWALILHVFVRRSANVNLTQLDQNDLPRILLKGLTFIGVVTGQGI